MKETARSMLTGVNMIVKEGYTKLPNLSTNGRIVKYNIIPIYEGTTA